MWSRHPWGQTHPGPQDAAMAGRATLNFTFPDPKRRLETAHEDLRLFLAAGGIATGAGGYAIETASVAGLPPEAFRLHVDQKGCRILASDTRGHPPRYLSRRR